MMHSYDIFQQLNCRAGFYIGLLLGVACFALYMLARQKARHRQVHRLRVSQMLEKIPQSSKHDLQDALSERRSVCTDPPTSIAQPLRRALTSQAGKKSRQMATQLREGHRAAALTQGSCYFPTCLLILQAR